MLPHDVRKFVIVAGDAASQTQLRDLLEVAGDSDFEVLAVDRAAAVDWGGDASPACVVVVHEPPAVDGVALLDEWQAKRWLRRCGVVIITDDREVRRAALRAGAAECLERRSLTGAGLREAIEDAADRAAFARRSLDTERRAESLTRRVLDNLFAFVGILELDGTLIEVNAAPLEVAGLTLEDVHGKRFWDCAWWSYSPEARARVRDACERAARGETARYDAEIRVAGDERMIIDFQLVPLRDANGRITHLVPSAVDITARKRVEQILRESEGRLRLAQDAAGLGIHDFDITTGAIRWDPRVRELWGAEPDEPITYELFMDGIHPDDRAMVQAAVEHATDPESDGVYLVEYRIRSRKDGRYRWAGVSGQTTFEHGAAVRLIGTVQDISARKHAEEVLRQSQEQLRESDRRKDEFLAMLGHELRNPLAAIHNAAELLRRAHGHDPQLAKIRAVFERQIHHMIRLIDGLLEVSRIAWGKINLEWSTIDLREVLAAVLDDRREQLADGLQVDLRTPDQPLWVWADEVRLAQIFDNLIGNAIKFSTAPGRIRIVADRVDESIVVWVPTPAWASGRSCSRPCSSRFSRTHSRSTAPRAGSGSASRSCEGWSSCTTAR